MLGRRAGDIERGFHGRLERGREAPVERDLKDELEVQIHHVERRQIAEAVKRFVRSSFRRFDERDDLINESLIQSAAWLPKNERQLFPKQDMGREFHVNVA